MPYAEEMAARLGAEELKLLQQKFPNFRCLCELCDCGCVQRKGGHAKNCRKKNHTKLPQESKECALSHYQQTYLRPTKSHRRLPVIPHPDAPKDYDEKTPMQLITTQRTDYTQRGEGERQGLLKRPENYEKSSDKMPSKTSYNVAFTGQTQFPALGLQRPGTQQKTRLVSATFDPRTTNKESFRDWIPEPSMCFQDLPSFAGSILYPGKTLGELRSVTQVDYPGAVGPKPKQAKMNAGNITIEGTHDLATTHNLAFVDMGNGHRAANARRDPQLNTNRKAKFEGTTQTMTDYGQRSRSHPISRSLPFDPPEPTIQLSFDSRLDFTTEQRSQFEGHDTNVHRRPSLQSKSAGNIERSHVKFHTDTTNSTTYKPTNVHSAYIPRSKAIERARRIPTSAKFDDQTINKRYYKNWGAKPRVRYGDIRELASYHPPREPMETETSTTSVYRTPQDVQPTANFKPVDTAIAHSGKHDFSTVHRQTYQGEKPTQCKAQLFLMQQEIKKRKLAHEHVITST